MSQSWDVSSGVGLTALAAAAGRAVETSRVDGLLDDPFAAAFVAAAPSPVPLPVRWPAPGETVPDQELLLLYGAGYVGLRTRFFDDELHRVCSAGVRQVVLLAAGLDARAFRLDWLPGVRVFELDQPAVLSFKDSVLAGLGGTAYCERTAVGVDLRADWAGALIAAGFDPTAPTAWLAEGLLQYLPAAAEQALFERIQELSAPGSQLLLERSANLAGLVDSEAGAQRLREVSERTGIAMDQIVNAETRPDPVSWLAGRGWTVTEEAVGTVADRYHRDLANPGLPHPRALATPAAGPTAAPAAGPASTSYVCAHRPG
jgi:methyltransferase (TIGR00027 family)